MAYNEQLALRISALLVGKGRVVMKHMFGGVVFMVRGRMCCGIHRDDLMVRVRPDEYEMLLQEPGARPMDITRRPMKGFLFVGHRGYGTPRGLRFWIDAAWRFITTTRAKAPRRRARRRKSWTLSRRSIESRATF